jgi:DivIVA domain-containing protein
MSTPLDDERYPNVAEIPTKRFRLGLKGYNVDQVDEFLGALEVEARALRADLAAAEAEVARLKDQLAEE